MGRVQISLTTHPPSLPPPWNPLLGIRGIIGLGAWPFVRLQIPAIRLHLMTSNTTMQKPIIFGAELQIPHVHFPKVLKISPQTALYVKSHIPVV